MRKAVGKMTLQRRGPCLSALGRKPFGAAGVMVDPKAGCGGVNVVACRLLLGEK